MKKTKTMKEKMPEQFKFSSALAAVPEKACRCSVPTRLPAGCASIYAHARSPTAQSIPSYG